MTALPHSFLLLLLSTLLALGGCDRGPGPEQARGDLLRQLDERFQEGLFAARSFERRGSAPFRDVERGHSGLYIYYDAELEFQRDYNLADWRGLNLGTLAYVLGATEAGVLGFTPKGNNRGDLLTVYGRIPYQDVDGDWVAFVDGAQDPRTSADQAQRVRGPGPDAVLQDARALLKRSPEVEPGGMNAVIITQLEHAVEQVDLSRATMKGMITLGTGPAGGTYHAFGRALSRYANEHKSPLFPYPSVGSVQNASMVQNGSLDFGLVQSDVAQFLYQGSVPEGFYPNRNLRTVASLWPEAVHVVTLAGTGIRSMADLDNKRVAIGVRGSGSRVNAVLIGLKADLGGDNLPNIREIGLAQAIRELERGKIDAFFLTEAVPAPALQELASRRKDVRFVSIGEEFIAKLAAQHFAYYPMYIESRTYPNQTEPFQTLGLAAALITNANVPDKKVNNMLESLLEGAVDLSRKYYRAAFITRETMRLGIAVPLHPAAERFYDRYDARPPAEAAALDPAPAPRPDPG